MAQLLVLAPTRGGYTTSQHNR